MRHARYHTGRVFSVYGSSSSEIHKFQAGCWPAIAWRRIHSSRRSPIETLRKWRWQTTELQNRGDTKSHRCGAGTIYCFATKRSGKYIAFNPNCGVLEYVGSSMHYLTYLGIPSDILLTCKGQRAVYTFFQEQMTSILICPPACGIKNAQLLARNHPLRLLAIRANNQAFICISLPVHGYFLVYWCIQHTYYIYLQVLLLLISDKHTTTILIGWTIF